MKTVFRLRCRRAAYYLNKVVAAGATVDRVSFEGGLLTFAVKRAEAALVEEVLQREGAEYVAGGFLGVKPLFLRFVKRPFLFLSVLLTLAGIVFFESFVYGYTVKGNRYVNTETVAAVLRDNHADGFTAKRSLDLARLKREIGAIDGVSFASVKVVGTRLQVEVEEELPFTEPDPLSYKPIVASESAIVTRVVAESGTPRVSSGDRVEKGALLIEPVYAFTEGVSPAPARGEVWGRVTYMKELVLPAMTVEEVMTGERFRTHSVRLFGKTIRAAEPCPYPSYRLEERLIYSSFGVEVTERVYRRVAAESLYHDFDRDAPALLSRALSDLFLSLPVSACEKGGVRVTQKKLDNVLITVLYYTVEQRIDTLP